jgi:hypothetical protein
MVNLTTYPWIAPMAFFLLEALALYPGCTLGTAKPEQSSTGFASLFAHIIVDIDSPALTLQALLATVYRVAYYASLPTFDSETIFNFTSFVSAQVPLRQRGFWTVVCVTLGHFVLCVLALIVFALLTRPSLLSYAWGVIADVAVNEKSKTPAGTCARGRCFGQ